MRLSTQIIPDEMLTVAYRNGLFPMADGNAADADINFFQPVTRGVIWPQRLHVPRRLLRVMRHVNWSVRWCDDVRAVIAACAAARDDQWLNPVLIESYAHWDRVRCLSVFDGDARIGGIYGVQCGGVFMAESMFSRTSNASSVALIVLVAGLARAGIALIDVQWKNAHTAQFGVQDISRAAYQKQLAQEWDKPVALQADYFTLPLGIAFAQSLSQTS